MDVVLGNINKLYSVIQARQVGCYYMFYIFNAYINCVAEVLADIANGGR